MRKLVVLLSAMAVMVAFAPPASAQEETVVNVKTATTVRADGLRLFGRVSAPFSPRGAATVEEDCVGDREVEVSKRSASGYRTVATDLTSTDGRWSLRVRKMGAVYRIRVHASEFAYSPAYGELEIVRCRPTTVTGTLKRRGFRIASVLGTRFGRAGVGRLPATGPGTELYVAVAGLLLAIGSALLRSTRARRIL